MVTPQVLIVVFTIAVSWFVGTEIIHGAKWVGKEAKKGGAAIVHVLKKIPHPHHKEQA